MVENTIIKRNEELLARTIPQKLSLERMDHHVQCIITDGLDVMNEFLLDTSIEVEQRIKAFAAILRVANYVEKRKGLETHVDDELIIDDEDMVF